MEIKKRNLTIIVLTIVLTVSVIGNVILGIQLSYIAVIPEEQEVLTIGVGSGLEDLDPCDSRDQVSSDVIRQVSEPLFFYDLRDPNLPRENWLARNYSWVSPITLEINLRSGIKFHDGNLMDATAAAWNIDRLIWLMNHTGEMPAELTRAKIHSLYEFPDGSPVMNKTEVVGNDTFRIILNAPYTQLLAAMAYVSCNILSPASTPADRFLDKYDPNDLLVGTGPYVYEYYTADTEVGTPNLAVSSVLGSYTWTAETIVRLYKWDNYWGTPSGDLFPQLDILEFDFLERQGRGDYALLACDVDFASYPTMDLFNKYKESPYITFHENEQPDLTVSFLSFNNKQINVTWRKAITYAINYSYIIQDYWQDQMIRANSWISPGYGDYYDDTLWDDIAPDDGNWTHARKVIKDALGPVNAMVDLLPNDGDAATDTAWEAVTIATFNYSYNTDNQFRSDLYPLLKDWLRKIGIYVLDGGTNWEYFLNRVYGYVPGGYDQISIYWDVCGPDYPDPMNIIQLLVSNLSTSNSAQINDPWIESIIVKYNTDQTLTDVERIELVRNITKYLVTESYSFAWGYHSKVFTVHKSDLYNVPYNTLGDFWALPIERNATWVPGQWYNTL